VTFIGGFSNHFYEKKNDASFFCKHSLDIVELSVSQSQPVMSCSLSRAGTTTQLLNA